MLVRSMLIKSVDCTGVLKTLYLSPRRLSPFYPYLFGCRCFDRSLPPSDAHPPLSPLSIRLQERCTLSTSLGCAPPLSAAICPPTGSLHAPHLSWTHISPFNYYLPSCRCIARSPPFSYAHLPFYRYLFGHRRVSRSPPHLDMHLPFLRLTVWQQVVEGINVDDVVENLERCAAASLEQADSNAIRIEESKTEAILFSRRR